MKNKFRITLDIIMLALTVTLFSKSFISLAYHEITGLILIGLMILHIAVNVKIIKAMCSKFMRIPVEIKLGVIIDIALILCFAWIGISGIFISRTILTSISSGNIIFKLGHMFAGGLSVILLGIHIGLHMCRKPMPAIPAVVMSVIVLFGGICGVVKSNEMRWLSIPATSIIQTDNNSAPDREKAAINNENHDNENTPPENNINPHQGKGENSGRHPESSSLSEKGFVVFMFTCMILLCSMITYWIVIIKRRRTRKS